MALNSTPADPAEENNLADATSKKLKEFRKSVRERVPNLAKVAGELLSVPAPSADAERSFSKLTSIQTHQRQQMSFETLKMSIFLYYKNSETNI